MHRSRASTRLAGCAAVVAVLALAGCGGHGDPAAGPSDGTSYEATDGQLPSPAPTGPSATATPPGQGVGTERNEALEQLAADAQAQAGIIASQGPLAPRTAPVLGADISWPQCPAGMGIPHKISSGQPMPRDDAEYVVIGLTNGPGFHANPCLADQVTYAKDRGLLTAAYAVASFPDDATVKAYGRQGPYPPEDPGAALRNTGYMQARFNVASMNTAGLESPIVWIDVESVPFYDWSTDPVSNGYVISGLAKGYLDSGLRIGVYSTPHLWASVVGGLTLDQAPEWRAAGQTSITEALNRCGPDWSIQGGEAVLGQWVEESRDRNITCPGVETDLGTWFAAPPAG